MVLTAMIHKNRISEVYEMSEMCQYAYTRVLIIGYHSPPSSCSEVYDTSNMQEGSRLWRLWALNQVKIEGGFKEMIYTVRCVAVCVVVLL